MNVFVEWKNMSTEWEFISTYNVEILYSTRGVRKLLYTLYGVRIFASGRNHFFILSQIMKSVGNVRG